MNQDEVLTTAAARTRVADVIRDYQWLWKDERLDVPIRPDDYYGVAIEANGNLTLAERQTGQLVLFAPDHGLTTVTPLAGCPPYSLMTIDGVPNLSAWIESCAQVWLDA
jgi:hypothetical protein